ncbi:MAG: hypothetical protein KKF89_00395 [Nanoarchaeota archaeon]|nr:hypothetical protein [Nanoarchaeota archaeon]MBU1854155.1 hypothetical protein [Nanoarchaeota archaeon]
MKLAIILAILLILIGGCSTVQDLPSEPTIKTTHTILEIHELVLNEQDLQQLGIEGNETNCKTEEQTAFDLSMVQYSVCSYIISNLNDTQVIIELKKFTNSSELENAYQYESSHLYSVEGLISENDYGDQSRFRVSNEHDYGGQYNDPNVYYYHLWICKDLYLIHITSIGRSKEAVDYIAKIGRRILSKYE